MVTATKPDPQGYTLAAMHCKALPWECVGVEGSAAALVSPYRELNLAKLRIELKHG